MINKEGAPIKENNNIEAIFDGKFISVVADKNSIKEIAQKLLDASKNKKDLTPQFDDCLSRGLNFNGDLEILFSGKTFLVRMLIALEIMVLDGMVVKGDKYKIQLGGGGNITPTEIMNNYFTEAIGIELKEM